MKVFGFEVGFSEEVEVMPHNVLGQLEEVLGALCVSTTASLVRLDMSPLGGIYEVELAPGGLAFWAHFKGGLPAELIQLADFVVLPFRWRFQWEKAYRYLCEVTGWQLLFSFEELPPEGKVYASCLKDEVPESFPKDRLITDPWMGKIVPKGRLLTPNDNLKKLLEEFPNGFVLKPSEGWGAKDILIYLPPSKYPKDIRKMGHTQNQVCQVIERVQDGRTRRTWWVQPFWMPELWNGYWRIWRIYAVRLEAKWKVLGGLWNARPSLLVHGASDAVIGLVEVERR